jgi:anti-sigma B factor antagonist
MIGELQLAVERQEGVAVIRAAGELDVATTADLRAVVAEHMSRHHAIVIDLRELDFIDSAGISCLVAAHRRAGDESAHVGVVPGEAVDRVLELTGLEGELTLLESD